MVRTRFAPSPTGYLHIGGVRTALFNWLYTRRHGGQFILRIDDTDRERNIEEALQPILDGFKWLGIHWDEGPGVGGDQGPYYQSEKFDRYQEAVRHLVERGLAYHDYASPDEIKEEREAAQKAGNTFRYSRRWMAETPEQRQTFESKGRKGVVRLKMPAEGKCVIQDEIRGTVEFEWGREQDHVIQRTDGTCLYHLASVVDDEDMGITHVIRAEEHLSNTPRQVFIAEGLGYKLPAYAHLPYVAEPGSKNKMSKRKLTKYLKNPAFAKMYEHGRAISEAIGFKLSPELFNPVIVDFYATVGYLPDAIVNYILLLGWALDEKTEFFTRDEMIKAFSLDRVNKAPASFDPDKLMAFQDRYMQQVDTDRKLELVLPYLKKAGIQAERETVSKIVQAAGDRIKVAGDILDHRDFFTPDADLAYDEKAFGKRIQPAPELLAKFRERLAAAEAFDAPSLEQMMKGFIETEGIKIGRIIHAVRVAVTGKAVGFGMFETLEILGKERCLARIDRALEKAK